jgi:hypothetical protein
LGMSVPEMGTGAARSSLADALFTTVQQDVLGLLFGQPDRRFQSAEIIRLAQGGAGSPPALSPGGGGSPFRDAVGEPEALPGAARLAPVSGAAWARDEDGRARRASATCVRAARSRNPRRVRVRLRSQGEATRRAATSICWLSPTGFSTLTSSRLSRAPKRLLQGRCIRRS